MVFEYNPDKSMRKEASFVRINAGLPSASSEQRRRIQLDIASAVVNLNELIEMTVVVMIHSIVYANSFAK